MGLPNSKKAKKEKKEKEKRIVVDESDDDKEKDTHITRILLLGACQSGKSTIFKQLKQRYGCWPSESQRHSYISYIHHEIIRSMHVLLQEYNEHGNGLLISNESKIYIENTWKSNVKKIDHKIAFHLKNLWATPGIQETYENESKFHLVAFTEYFLQRLDKFMEDGYVPDMVDLCRPYTRTVGCVGRDFEIDGNIFKVIDVGGKPAERSKWIHCFEDVSIVIFFASLSGYNHTLFEYHMYRMNDAINLFGEICNSQWFKETEIILFLTKKDIFQMNFKQDPFSSYYPKFKGSTCDDAIEFIQGMFENKNHRNKSIYTHVVCPISTENVFTTFDKIKDIMISATLKETYF